MDKKSYLEILLSGFLSIAAAVLVTAVVLVMAACSPPIGSFSGGGGGELNGGDALWAVPNRFIYSLEGDGSNGVFRRGSDLQLFVSDSGAVYVVNTLSTVVVMNIFESPGDPLSKKPVNGLYYFSSPGRKEIEITYNNMTTKYSVQVEGVDISGGDNGNGGGGGTIIEWIQPPSIQVILSTASGIATINPGTKRVYSEDVSAVLKAKLYGDGGEIITKPVTWTRISGDFAFDSQDPDTVSLSSNSPVTILFNPSGITSNTDAVIKVTRDDNGQKSAEITIQYRPVKVASMQISLTSAAGNVILDNSDTVIYTNVDLLSGNTLLLTAVLTGENGGTPTNKNVTWSYERGNWYFDGGTEAPVVCDASAPVTIHFYPSTITNSVIKVSSADDDGAVCEITINYSP